MKEQLSKLKKLRLKPVCLSLIIFVMAVCLLFAITPRVDKVLNANNIYFPPQPTNPIELVPQPPTTNPAGDPVPEVPAPAALLPVVLYFAALILVLTLILFFIPLSMLKIVFRSVFAFLFAWGVFILTVFYLPTIMCHIMGTGEITLNLFGRAFIFGERALPSFIGMILSAALGLGIGFVWLLKPKMWLHNLLLLVAVASMASVFGRIMSPWTAMILLGIFAVYDLLAVRFGFMMWMANKMSQSAALPAFVLPRRIGELQTKISHVELNEVAATKPEERDFSVLGGGDIAFPLMLTASVFFARGWWASLLTALFCMVGLYGAYFLQRTVFKGKPVPAIPPIAFMGLLGLIVAYAFFPALQ